MNDLQQLKFVFDTTSDSEVVEVAIDKRKAKPKFKKSNVSFIASEEEAEKERLANWALQCVSKYFEMTLQAKARQLPSMTSRLSDMPSHTSGGFHSSTESTALKKVAAAEWLDTFNKSLDYLPQLHKTLIVNKYLTRSSDGQFRYDDRVYENMHLSRSSYYRLKKEALYWLGLQLAEEEIMDFGGRAN